LVFRLRNTNISIRFITNTTNESKNLLYDRLIRLGFDIKKNEIFSSLVAAKQVVRYHKMNPLLLLDNAALEEFRGLVDLNSPFNAVVVGLAPDKFNYKNLNDAFR
jgi:ribonucleotide monophosphatase NagD (HAD superfamily)